MDEHANYTAVVKKPLDFACIQVGFFRAMLLSTHRRVDSNTVMHASDLEAVSTSCPAHATLPSIVLQVSTHVY